MVRGYVRGQGLGVKAYLPRGSPNLSLLYVVVALPMAGRVQQLVHGLAAPSFVQMVEVMREALPALLLTMGVECLVGFVNPVEQAQPR
jgi:hypothetical protein